MRQLRLVFRDGRVSPPAVEEVVAEVDAPGTEISSHKWDVVLVNVPGEGFDFRDVLAFREARMTALDFSTSARASAISGWEHLWSKQRPGFHLLNKVNLGLLSRFDGLG